MVAATLAYRLGFDRAIANGRTTLEGLIVAVEKTAAIGAYTFDTVLLQEVAVGLSRNPLSAKVEIRNPMGTLLVMTLADGVSADTASKSEVTVERSLQSPFDAKESVGVLRIKANMAHLQATARAEAVTLAVLMTAQTVAVAVLLYLVASRFVSRPIVILANTLRLMKPGAGKRLLMPPLHQNDEIGVLISGANALLHANEIALRRERDLRAEIEKMEAQYRQIFDSSSAGIFVLNADGHLINSNPTALKMVGLPMSDIHRLQREDFVQQVFARPERMRDMIADAGRRNDTVSADIELRDNGGVARWVHCLISVQNEPPSPSSRATDQEPNGIMVEGVMYDVTERKKVEKAVQHQAEHDGLTGLKNRATSDVEIDRFIADAAKTETPVSLLYIDLDGFKRVNDVLGHKAGDQVLILCAYRMRAAVRRSSDLIARVGGDEFLVALHNVGPGDVNLSQVARDLVDTLCEPIVLDDGQIAQIGASIGIACYPNNGVTRKALLYEADAVMYEVKRTGKNSFAVAVEFSSV